MSLEASDVKVGVDDNPYDHDERVVKATTDDGNPITWLPVDSLYTELEARQHWVDEQQDPSDTEAEYGDCRFCDAEDVPVGVTTKTICLDCATTALDEIEQYAEEHPDELLGKALD